MLLMYLIKVHYFFGGYNMKVAIVGSRGLADIDKSKYVSPDVTEINTGGAKGVDSLAEK